MVDDDGEITKGPDRLKSLPKGGEKKIELVDGLKPKRADYDYDPDDSFQEFMHKNVEALRSIYNEQGREGIEDEWFNLRLNNCTGDFRVMSDEEIDEAFDKYINPSTARSWLLEYNSDVKPGLVMQLTASKDVHNAALNVMYENYKYQCEKEKKSPLPFEEFLVTPIKMYRGGSGKEYRRAMEFSSYTFDKEVAKMFKTNPSGHGDPNGDGVVYEAEIRPIDTYGSLNTSGESEIFVPRPIAPNKNFDEEPHMDGIDWEWSDPVKWAFEDSVKYEEPEESDEEEAFRAVLDDIIREAQILNLYEGKRGLVADQMNERCIDAIQKMVMQLTAMNKGFNGDSVFFEGELDDNLGENEVIYPEVDAFRERRKKRLDEKEEGRWITTDGGYKIHLNEEGEPDKGNPHVIEKMSGGPEKSGARPAKSVKPRKSVLSEEQRKDYSDIFAKLKKESAELRDFQEHANYKAKDYDPGPYNEADRRRKEILKEAEGIVSNFPAGTILTKGSTLYEKKIDGSWEITSPKYQYNGGGDRVAWEISGYVDDVDYPPVEFIADSGDAKMVKTIELKSDEIYEGWADAINSKERKDLVKMAKKDPEFKELVDGIVIYTEGAYVEQRKTAEGLVRDGLTDASAETVGEVANDSWYRIRDLWKGQNLKSSESSVAGGMAHLVEAINKSKPHEGKLYRVAQDRRILSNESDKVWEPPKPGEKIKMEAPTSFTSEYGVEEELSKMKMGDVIHYELESGAHALNIQALSRYKQAEYLCCGEYEVVSVKTEKRAAYVHGEPSEAIKKRGIKTNRWGEPYVETYVSTIKIKQIGDIGFGKRDDSSGCVDCAGHFDDRMAFLAEVVEFRERRQKRLDAKAEEGRWVTTEEDHRIHLNEEGVPDKGNPYVIKAMTSGTKTPEELGKAKVTKARKKIGESIAEYKSLSEKVSASAEKYARANQEYKQAERRLEMVDKIYKKTLDENGIKEGDGEALKKEVEELKKQLDANPLDREISARYNNRSFLLSEYEDVYGDETKEYREKIGELKKNNDDAKRELDGHIEKRKAALKEAKKHMAEKDAQSLKFYSESERNDIKKSVVNSDGFKKLSDEDKAKISESIGNASDAQLAVLQKTMGKARIMKVSETAYPEKCSHYSSGNGCVYLEDNDMGNPRVFWHEYGHFMDDSKHSGMDIGEVSHGEGTIYEGSSTTFSGMLRDNVKLYGKDAEDDLRELFEKMSPGEVEVKTNDSEDWINVSDVNGDMYDPFSSKAQRAFDKVCKEYLDNGPDGGELGEYYRSIGYPSYDDMPKREDYIESYVTPKRKLERERERYKGAQEEYHKKLMEYYDKREAVEAAHPEFRDTVDRFYKERAGREKTIAPVTDCMCALMHGKIFSIYGCHDQQYYRTGYHAENEWAANIHQMMFTGDKGALDFMSKMLPRTMKKVKAAYNEYLWRNIG